MAEGAVMDADTARREPSWLFGDGTMGELIRAYDWSRTPLGPIGTWPQSLRTVVNLILAARQPVYVAWSPQLILLHNDACIPILGSKHPGALGKPCPEVWPEVWKEYGPIVQATMAGQAQHFVDQPVALASRAGRPVSWFTFSWTPLRDETGAIAGFYCAATETSEKTRTEGALRARSEAALRASEERLRRALETETVGVIFFDPTGTIKEANDAFLGFSGFTREEVAAGRLHWQALTPPEHLPASWRAFKALMTTGRATPYEKEYFRKDGSRWWGLFAPRLLDKGEAVEFILEITERKGIELALRESEERFRLMADAVPQIVWITDTEGRVEFFNLQWSNYTGVPYEPTTVAEVVAGFIHPDDAALTLERFEEAQRTGGTYLVEHRIRAKGGGYRWVLARGEPYRDPGSGEIVRWLGSE